MSGYKPSSACLLTLVLDVVTKSLTVGTVRLVESGRHMQRLLLLCLQHGLELMGQLDYARSQSLTHMHLPQIKAS